MITSDDAVLALSNSGATAELVDLIAYTRRFEIPLIAITAGAEFELARHSNFVLVLPRLPEACPIQTCAHHVDHHDAGAGRCTCMCVDGSAWLY